LVKGRHFGGILGRQGDMLDTRHRFPSTQSSTSMRLFGRAGKAEADRSAASGVVVSLLS